MNRLGHVFNEYATEFAKVTTEADQDFIIELGDVTVYLFGSDERKNAWWRERHPGCGDGIYFSCVSSRPIEIIGDVRQTLDGEYVINPLSLGHELLHALRIVMSNWTLRSEEDGVLLSPDKYTEI